MSRPTISSQILPSRTLSLDLKLLCLSNSIGAFGDGLFVYILPIYIRGLGATAADVGLLFSLLTLSTALTIIPGGFFADRFDRKKIMILGWLIWVPLPLIISIATHWSQLILPMSLYGFFLSGPATSAYVATTANKEKMTLTFTTISASWSVGYIFSPALGGYLATIIGMQWVFILAFCFYSIATGVLLFIRSQHATKPVDPAKVTEDLYTFRIRRIIYLSVFFASAMFFLTLVRQLVVQFLKDVFYQDSFRVGVLGSIMFFGWAVFSIGLGKIGDRLRKMVAVATSLLIASVSFGLLLSFNNFPSLALASFLNGASFPIWSLMNACIGAIAPEASRGRLISLSQVTAVLATFIAPYLGGVLYEASPYTPFYVVIAVSPLLALFALTKPFRET